MDGAQDVVRVMLEIWGTAGERMDGALTVEGSPARRFAGVLELLAALEDAVAAARRDAPPTQADPTPSG